MSQRWWLLLGFLLPATVWGQGPYRWARVTSVAPGAASIDAGSVDGLRDYTRVEIVRRGRAVAVLRVVTLGPQTTACAIASRPIPLLVGDSARYLPSGRPAGGVAVAVPAAPPVPGPPPVVDTTPFQPVAPAPVRRPAAAPAPAPSAPVRPTTRIVTPAPGALRDTSLGAGIAPAPPVANRDTTRRPAAVVTDTARRPPAVVARPAPTPPPVVAAPDTARRPPVVVAKPAPAPPPVPAPSVRPPAVTPPAVQAPPAVAVTPPSAPAPIGPSARMARVTFVTTSSAYVSAGKAEGLGEGSRVDVVRRGRAVAELKVAFLSTHQASCQIVSVTDSVAVGDSVRYLPVAGAGAPAVAAQATRPVTRLASQRSSRSSTGRIRGRLGLYYLTVQQRDSFGGRLSQPSGDLRLNGVGIGGSPLGLAIDVRTRRSMQAPPGSATRTTDQTRIYQALVFWQVPGSPLRFATGRQYTPGISSIGLMDGASAELHGAKVDLGLFGGMQPEPIDLGFSSDISQLGGYVRFHSRSSGLGQWSTTIGLSGSYHTGARDTIVGGRTNREFAYLQASYLTRHVSVYAVQEIDYYRWWRRMNGDKAVSPTSTFANLQYQVSPALSLMAGIDNRRSVRLYRDFVNPVTTFDDTFRRGIWAGFTTRVSHFQAAFDARTSHDSATGTANTYTLGLGADRLTPLGVSVRSRSSRFTTPNRQGWLNSISLGLEPFGRGSLQLTSGWRSDKDSLTITNTNWFSADMDVTLMRSLFLIVSAYRERGGTSGHDLLYAGVSFRF